MRGSTVRFLDCNVAVGQNQWYGILTPGHVHMRSVYRWVGLFWELSLGWFQRETRRTPTILWGPRITTPSKHVGGTWVSSLNNSIRNTQREIEATRHIQLGEDLKGTAKKKSIVRFLILC